MVSFHDLVYFQAVARLGTLRQAAQELHVSQPALTHSLKRLEKTLGATLFERSKKGMRLTPVGDQLVVQSEGILEDLKNLSRSIANHDQQVNGRCRLGCHSAVARYSLAKFIPQLMKGFPDLEISVSHDLSRNITQGVIDSSLDVGIVVNPVSHPDLVISELGTDEVGLWKLKGNSTPEDVLIFDPSLAQSQWILTKCEKKKILFKRKIESSDLLVIRELALAGAGVAILPARVALLGEERSLVRVHSAIDFQDRIALVYKTIFSKTKIGKTVIAAIKGAKI